MLTREENEFLCRTDKGTPMGEFCRRFWTPVLPLGGDSGAGLPARAEQDLRRGAGGISHHKRQGGRAEGVLPAPPREPVLRPQRGRGPALRLSRLEVRHRRQLHRHDVGARRQQLCREGQDPCVPRAGGRWLRVGLHGAAGASAADAGAGVPASAGKPARGPQGLVRVQLRPGHRGRDRHGSTRPSSTAAWTRWKSRTPRRPSAAAISTRTGRPASTSRTRRAASSSAPSATPRRTRRTGASLAGCSRGSP